MTRRRRHALLAVSLALGLSGCGEPDEELPRVQAALDGVLATIAAHEGALQVKRAGQGAWEAAETATVLSAGDWVRTGRGASARVEFLPGGALELDEEAIVVIEALAPVEQKAPGLPDSLPLVSVQSGSVRSSLADHRGADRPLLVRSADGSRARVERRAGTGAAEARIASVSGQTEVAAVTGEVSLTTGERAAVVSAGTVATLQQNETRTATLPGQPTLAGPAADARLAAGAQTLRWEAVSGATAYRVQVARDAAFQQVVATGDGAETSFSFEGQPGALSWRVAARDESGRQGRWSDVRRLFLQEGTPEDLLEAPDDGATFGFTGAPPRIAFRWRPKAGARAYRLVVTKDRALLGPPVATELVAEPAARLETLAPGEYSWGVYAQGAEAEPLFLAPRRLTVKKVKGGAVVAPKRIRRWGE